MSANNQLIIKKNKEGKWTIVHWDIDCGALSDKFSEHETLEEAAKEANAFMDYQEVEYGLRIQTK